MTESTSMPIASASKLIFGAYVVERFKDNPAQIDRAAMTMRSGYTDFTSCGLTKTVEGCLALGANGNLSPQHVGKFFYGGGHYQKYAVDLGLGFDTTTKLAEDIQAKLGVEIALSYLTPQVAGGGATTAGAYTAFLRKILSGKLAIFAHLGEEPVCTLPASCPDAIESPIPEAWHYSLGHWVEDDPSTGDGSFSSPGLYGFYPWIASDKQLYGVLARHNPVAANSGVAWESVLCGRAIRAAFRTGQTH